MAEENSTLIWTSQTSQTSQSIQNQDDFMLDFWDNLLKNNSDSNLSLQQTDSTWDSDLWNIDSSKVISENHAETNPVDGGFNLSFDEQNPQPESENSDLNPDSEILNDSESDSQNSEIYDDFTLDLWEAAENMTDAQPEEAESLVSEKLEKSDSENDISENYDSSTVEDNAENLSFDLDNSENDNFSQKSDMNTENISDIEENQNNFELEDDSVQNSLIQADSVQDDENISNNQENSFIDFSSEENNIENEQNDIFDVQSNSESDLGTDFQKEINDHQDLSVGDNQNMDELENDTQIESQNEESIFDFSREESSAESDFNQNSENIHSMDESITDNQSIQSEETNSDLDSFSTETTMDTAQESTTNQELPENTAINENLKNSDQIFESDLSESEESLDSEPIPEFEQNIQESSPDTSDGSWISFDFQATQPQEISQISENNSDIPFSFDSSEMNSDINSWANSQSESQVSPVDFSSSETTTQLDNQNTQNLGESNNFEQTEQPEIQSTLSLDQLFDSELQTNSHMADLPVNTVQTNIQNVSNSWSASKKKLITALMWVWLFWLVFTVAYLAFPTAFNLQSSSTQISNSDLEIHGSWIEGSDLSFPDPEIENSSDVEIQDNQNSESDFNNHNSAPSTVEFPDPEEDLWNSDSSIAKPYTWEPEIYQWEDGQELAELELSAQEILSEISSFKSQGEMYYEVGQESLDKTLVRYASQIIHLCDSYEQEILNNEWVTSTKFSDFKTKIDRVIQKINAHNSWPEDEVSTVVVGNSNDDSYFEGKDELKDYLYNR